MVAAVPPEQSLAGIATLFQNGGVIRDFQREFVRYVQQLLGARHVVLFERRDEKAEPRAATNELAGQRDRSVLASLAKEAAKALRSKVGHRLPLTLDETQHLALVVPFFLKDSPAICVTAVLAPERIAFAEPSFTLLHLSTQLLVQRELASDLNEQSDAFHQATLLVEMISRTNDADTFKRAAFSLVMELQKFFGCDRVALGVGDSHRCRALAVSGMSSKQDRSLGLSHLSAAMREALALDHPTTWPAQQEMTGRVRVSANQDDLLRSFDVGRIFVTPLKKEDGTVVGAWALLWRDPKARLESRTLNLVDASLPHVASLLEMLRSSKPGLLGGWRRQIWNHGPLRRLAVIGALIAVIGLMWLPVPHRISADCRVQPVDRRTVAAPFDSRLQRTFVKPGDRVEQGQLMAELDDRELRMKLAETMAARNVAVTRRDQAMVENDAPSVLLAQLEADGQDLEVKRLRFQLDHLQVTAPVGGLVLSGDLARSVGVPVSKGQKLFEVAPLDRMLVELAIPETDIKYVRPGLPVEVRLESQVSYRWKSNLDAVYPVSEIHDGGNVFVGEAFLGNPNNELRPGMRGAARLVSSKKPLGWVLFHKLWEYLRLKFW